MSDMTRYEGNEPPGFRRQGIMIAGVFGFMLFAALCMGALYFLYLPFSRNEAIVPSQFPEPQLQSSPPADLAKMLKQQRDLLTTSHWRDEENGILAIPIDAAMKEIAKKGNAGYGPLTDGPADQSARPAGAVAPEDRSANPGAGGMQPDRVPQ